MCGNFHAFCLHFQKGLKDCKNLMGSQYNNRSLSSLFSTRPTIVYNFDFSFSSFSSITHMNGRFEWKIFRLSGGKKRSNSNNEGIKSINDFTNLFFRSSLMVIVHNMIWNSVVESRRKLMNGNQTFNWIKIPSRSRESVMEGKRKNAAVHQQ